MTGEWATSGRNFHHFDVVVVGTGPAGVAVAERLHEINDTLTIAIVERGSFLLGGHFYDSGGSIHDRDQFFARHSECPWDGDLGRGGALLPALGGRGIVGGSQLHRFYPPDFTLWARGRWGVDANELNPYYAESERRLLGTARSTGRSQDHACAILRRFNAQHPPGGTAAGEVGRRDFGYPHRSSAERLGALLEADKSSVRRRVFLFDEVNVTGLVAGRGRRQRVLAVRCAPSGPGGGNLFDIMGDVFVLAASPVESARLVLASAVEGALSNSSVVGRYLAEHIYCRGYLDVSDDEELGDGPVNVFIPPAGTGLDERYQVELRSMTRSDGRKVVRVTGSAAMDPSWRNRITLQRDRLDRYGVPRAMTSVTPSIFDQRRTVAMIETLNEVASSLNAKWSSPPAVLPCGASYHECGTLRIAASEQESAADTDGRLFGTTNVYVGDGAAFASVGVANPILTLTAMGYRLADRLARKM